MEDVDIVLRVAKDSPAAVAGVEPGWLLLNGRDVMERAMVLGQPGDFPLSRSAGTVAGSAIGGENHSQISG